MNVAPMGGGSSTHKSRFAVRQRRCENFAFLPDELVEIRFIYYERRRREQKFPFSLGGLQKYGRKVQVQVTIFNPRDPLSQKLVCLQFSITFEIYMNSFPIHWFVNS